jgi:hypothetical protein
VLATLLPPSFSNAPVATATVSDDGGTYLVTVGERVKEYADSARDCAERARIAAAFIAFSLSLDVQPAAGTTTSATVPTAGPPPAPPPVVTAAPPSRTEKWLRVDARGTLEIAPQDGLLAPGAEARIAAGQGRFGAHALCGWLSGTSMSLPGETGRVLLERFPCAAGPTLRLFPSGTPLPLPPLEVSVDAGVALGAVRTSGRSFATNYVSARFEVGARIAVDAALHLGRHPAGFAPVVGLAATYYPMAYDLDVTPRTSVGRTPNLWAGLTAGVCWSIE